MDAPISDIVIIMGISVWAYPTTIIQAEPTNELNSKMVGPQ